jgi:hypothetical protein
MERELEIALASTRHLTRALPGLSRLCVTILVCWLSSGASAADMTFETNRRALEELSKSFTEARSLPSGSRPSPPSIDLQRLVGLRLSAIRNALGVPNGGAGHLPRCHASLCFSYSYGPAVLPETDPGPVDRGDGTMEMQVTTGGPWLLIIGVSDNQVVSADWLGQK